MASIVRAVTAVRWRRWTAIAVLLLAAYAALGFWAVPALVQRQLPSYGQSALERQLSVGDVAFNPFTLRLALKDLRLAEADGRPLFGVGALDTRLQWRSIVRRAWSFEHIRVTAPSANLVIAADGRFNVAELLATLDKDKREEPGDKGGMPRLVIDEFVLEQGKVDVRDEQAGYANVVAPIDFKLSGFSTLAGSNDTHTFTAQMARGGTVRWTGTSSLQPIQGSGELALDDVSLAEPSVYLKPFTKARIAAGKASARLPYRFSYADGRFDARLEGASLALKDVALAREGAGKDAFASLALLQVSDASADLAQRQAAVGELRMEGGKLTVRRDAKGDVDLASLAVVDAPPGAPPPAGTPDPAAKPSPWKLDVKQVVLDRVALHAVDETASPPLAVDAGRIQAQMQVAAEQAEQLQLKLSGVSFAVNDLAVASGERKPFRLASLGFSGGSIDLAARRASVGRVSAEGGDLQLVRNAAGEIDLLAMAPKPGPAAPAPKGAPAAPWTVVADTVEVGKFNAAVEDQETGIKVHVDDLAVKLAGASSDLAKPVKFDAGLKVREGGRLTAQGSVVPAKAEVKAQVRLQQLALAPLQPLLAKHVRLKLAGGHVSAQGQLTTGSGKGKDALVKYVGGFNVAGLVLNEDDGQLFASWRDVGAQTLTASVSPNRLDIPELRITQPNAKLIIEDDRSFNAARLLVKQPAAQPAGTPQPAPAAAPAEASADPFPVRVRRVRIDDARLDFTDLSLRPQFGARIYELNGVVNGLSSSESGRSQVELDGRVDDFGIARIRGELNPFKPRNNTDLNVVFRNVDLVPTSPYSMKFAGYRIAAGKISLDLQYKVRNSQLEGENKVVIDQLTLGEKVDSPDALKLPLELAIALLKDSDGRIDLGLPVSGNLDDPQFSYGALIWKVIGNVLTKIVTAPFRAIGALLGVGGDNLEAIDFDPGSARLLPPEREKLAQVAQVLGKRPQLKVSVPGRYSDAADGAAMRSRLVRGEVIRRTGVKLAAGEDPGPLDMTNRAVRAALRELYAERFGNAAIEEQRKALKDALGDDAPVFHRRLLERLDREQPLPPEALAQLGTQRAEAVVTALRSAGVDPARAVPAATGNTESEAGKPVPLKLELGAK
jgi:uncharacterized protein involved in outer membrane biogenesis